MRNEYSACVCVSGLSFWVDKEFTYSYGEELKNKIFPFFIMTKTKICDILDYIKFYAKV